MSQKAFTRLMRSLSTTEREQLLKTAMEYGLTTDDPAWIILALNKTGLRSIEKATEALNRQRKAEVFAFQQTAERTANAVMTRAADENILRISEELAKTAQKLYHQRELKVTTGWLVTAACIGISFFIAVNTVSYFYLKETIYKQEKLKPYQQLFSNTMD